MIMSVHNVENDDGASRSSESSSYKKKIKLGRFDFHVASIFLFGVEFPKKDFVCTLCNGRQTIA